MPIDVRAADVLGHEPPSAGLVVANIDLEAVETLLSRWPGRRAIASGYLARDVPEVQGWVSEERLELEGWAADRLARLV